MKLNSFLAQRSEQLFKVKMAHIFTEEERKIGIIKSSLTRRHKIIKSIENGTWFSRNLSTLRNYLIEKNGYRCNECQLDKWNNLKIVLEVHHIDGDRKNNKLENVILLCPNCHSQTDTFKNKKRV